MTSVRASYGQVPANKLYVNIAACSNFIFDSNLSSVAWSQGGTGLIAGQLSTVGAAIFRDLGTTLYVPSPTLVPVGAVPGISTVLRKVQLIPVGNPGTFGVGGTYAGTDVDYFTGYIQLGGLQQGGGGNGAPTKFARLN